MTAELTTIGLLGGMSWESTAVYYRLLNELVHERVGGHASAPELLHGVIREESRATYLAVIDRLVASGAEAIVLGCTEIGLLLSADDTSVPLLDTSSLHCQALADIIINGGTR